ncbi:hypothetical protein [Pseudoalteromonas sp. ASV78]|uniref:hypothetical protein n=1 Tax=Pseudoalteromonas sp. ASV78 TaxID=3397851 RepID=UPI0039FC3965
MSKNILLICPDFYDYKEKIETELLSKGYEVVSIKERPRRWVYSLIKRFSPEFLMRYFYDWYFCNYLNVLDGEYDEMLCIRGEVISEKFLTKLTAKNPHMRKILYQWDSVKVTNFMRIFDHFDSVKTFDFNDSEKMDLEYIPLFYGQEYEFDYLNSEIKYDIIYVGSFNNERYKVLKEIEEQCKLKNIKYYFHLYISPLDFIKLKLFSNLVVSRNDVKFDILTREEVVSLNAKSRSVLDIENIKQTGFTMRTFETLSTGRLLVTTNSQIDKLPEFKDQYIHIDRECIELPEKVKLFEPVKSTGIERYSLKNWLECVLK